MHGVVSTFESCVNPTELCFSEAFASAGASAVSPIKATRRHGDCRNDDSRFSPRASRFAPIDTETTE